MDITVRCNSCTALNDLVVDQAPDEYIQYGTPHIDLPAPFGCCRCGRKHAAGISVTLVVSEFIPTNDAEDRYNRA